MCNGCRLEDRLAWTRAELFRALVRGDHSCHGGLEFDLDLLEVGGADVFGGVGDGVAPACGAGFRIAFYHFAVWHGDFQFPIG